MVDLISDYVIIIKRTNLKNRWTLGMTLMD